MVSRSKKRKQAAEVPGNGLYVAAEQYRWVTYVEEGCEDDPTQPRVRIRKHLLNDELERLTFDVIDETGYLTDATGEPLKGAELAEGQRRYREALEAREAEVREAMAPFVVDWNIAVMTPSGEVVKADPPAIGGWEQFRFLPDRIVGQIYLDLRVRNAGIVKAKSWTPHGFGVDTTSESSSVETPAE